MGRRSSQSRITRLRWAAQSLGAIVACGTLATRASSQTVRGIVTSAGQPIPGVLLTLVDSATHIAARTLSNAEGQYVLVAPSAGRYRISSLRIGYRPTNSDWLDLRDDAPVGRPIALTGIPVALDAVRVVGRGECRLAADSSAATFAIWEQARGAMIAARVSSQKDSLLATKVVYEKTLDPSLQVRSARYAVAQSIVTDPWLSPSAEALERAGFVTTDSKGYITYNAPDLDVLLSDGFTIDHCFRLVESPDSTRVGLQFEPTEKRAKARGLTEIQGTIWLDRATSELRLMEFGYTNLPRYAQTAGGELQFARFRDGGWAIGEWSLRMPVMAMDRTDFRSGVDVAPRLASVQVVGGQLVIAARGTDTIFALPGRRVRGTVRDSITHSPVSGARVRIAGTPIDAVTDANGRFEGDALHPGVYNLEIHTASLDSIGAMNRIEFEFADTSKMVEVPVPTARQVTAKLCAATTGRSPRGLLIGRASSPPNVSWELKDKDVSIIARWTDASTKDRVHELSAKPDANGNFRVCGVPLDTPLSVRATVDQTAGLPTEIRVSSSSRFARVNLLVADRPFARIAGFVRADSTTTPLVAADVSLPDDGRATRSDDQGRFRIDSLEPGKHRIVVRQIGYEMIDTAIVLDGKDIFEPEFHLRRTAVLDSVRVVAGSRDLRMQEFEENRRLGLGHFFDRAEIAKKDGLTLTSVLADLTGARIVGGTAGSALASTRGAVTSLQNQVLDRGPSNKVDCYSTVYVDNVAVFRAGRGDPYFNLNLMRPEDIEAIEFYAGPAELPARYNQLNAACGVLVIHRRR